MNASWRPRLCLLALLPLLSLRAAEAPPPAEEPAAGQASPAPAPTPAAGGTEATPRPAPPPRTQEEEEPPLEPISADNNLTFPVDI